MALLRTAAHGRRLLRALLTVVVFVIFGALAFVFGTFVHSLGSVPLDNWNALLNVSAVFAILGAFFGSILAFDRRADAPAFARKLIRRFDAPILRTAICGALGSAVVVLVRSWNEDPFPFTWTLVGAAAGGILGWFGWRWAKYVDF